MNWFDVKIIFVRPTNPKIQAIALFLSAKLRPKTDSDQNKIVTIAFALSCQPFWHPYMYTFEYLNFWPNQWFQKVREGKSAIASIFGLASQIEMILTPNGFILTSLNMYLSFAQFTQFLLSLGFSLVSRFCRVNKEKGSVFYWLIFFVWPWNIPQSQKPCKFSL